MTDRILTTHTGSLPRTPKVVELLLAEEKHPGSRRRELRGAVHDAVTLVVSKQVECGLDTINDGEQGRTDYTVHVMRRLTGYDGPSAPPMGTVTRNFQSWRNCSNSLLPLSSTGRPAPDRSTGRTGRRLRPISISRRRQCRQLASRTFS